MNNPLNKFILLVSGSCLESPIFIKITLTDKELDLFDNNVRVVKGCLSLRLNQSIFFPVAGANEMLPSGVPFDSLSFLYLTSGHFFYFKTQLGLSPFLTHPTFITRRGGAIKDPYGFPN